MQTRKTVWAVLTQYRANPRPLLLADGLPSLVKIGYPENEQLAYIFTTLLPNIVGVGFNLSARLNSSV
jgi:hypothetical protein